MESIIIPPRLSAGCRLVEYYSSVAPRTCDHVSYYSQRDARQMISAAESAMISALITVVSVDTNEWVLSEEYTIITSLPLSVGSH